jgi:trehalose 6-phosphate synthase/phosphatase
MTRRKPRIILVSNRLSVSAKKTDAGELIIQKSIGGLATGLASLGNERGVIWVGWSGIPADRLSPREEKELMEKLVSGHGCHTVPLTTELIRLYYHGFSNDTIWPLFHYFPGYVKYSEQTWEAYKEVNRIFLETLKKIYRDGDIVWIHDYQLMLLPEMVRKAFPKAQIGFFLHIPFPSYEIFRLLPWRNEILEGMLGADLVGFHTYDYARHFLSAVRRILGYEHSLGMVQRDSGRTRVDVFPMGIDYERFRDLAGLKKTVNAAERMRKDLMSRRILLSVDRLDYSKGIPLRLKAYERFLELHPSYKGKVVLVLVVAPSRTEVRRYKELKKEIEELVGSINGTYGALEWEPVRYFYRSFSQEVLTSMYMAADVMMVTPLRDGMNLIAKEYVAARSGNGGSLIISETAGAASELGEAFVVNPNNVEDNAAAIFSALELGEAESRLNIKRMGERISKYTVGFWVGEFLHHLDAQGEIKKTNARRKIAGPLRKKIIREYAGAGRRLLLLDYDGTLRNFTDRPDDAVPGPDLKNLLENLSGDPRNEVVIVSGRGKDFFDKHFEGLNMGFIAGHGVWTRDPGEGWILTEPLSNEWKAVILPIFENFSLRTPGSSIEEKDFSLAWHYRRSEPDLAALRVTELKDALFEFISSNRLSLLDGHRVVEVRPSGINKGRGAGLRIARERWDFIFAAGDDVTDEDLFAAVGDEGYTVKVGIGRSRAGFALDNPRDVVELLRALYSASTDFANPPG